jgi:hypothetical protein
MQKCSICIEIRPQVPANSQDVSPLCGGTGSLGGGEARHLHALVRDFVHFFDLKTPFYKKKVSEVKIKTLCFL